MFTKFICFYAAVVCVCGAPPIDVVPLEKQQPTVIAIVAQSEELESNGTFKFSYETANGIKREETSYDKVLPKGKSRTSSNEAGENNDDDSNEIHVQQGSYSYTAPDGSVINVRYIADENGFRPIGDHLPKAPGTSAKASENKPGDNAEGGSEPAAATVEAPAKGFSKLASEAQKTIESNEIEPRISDQSLEQISAVEPEDSPTTPEEPSTNSGKSSTAQEKSPTYTEIPSTTADQSSKTADQSSTTQAESSTTTEIPSTTTDQSSTTPEESSTTEEESSTTTEISSNTPEKSSTSQEESSTTTEMPSTTEEESSTPEISSTSKASTELASPTSDITSSEVTSTESASTTQQAAKASSSEETSSPDALTTDALPDSTPNTAATTDASTPV